MFKISYPLSAFICMSYVLLRNEPQLTILTNLAKQTCQMSNERFFHWFLLNLTLLSEVSDLPFNINQITDLKGSNPSLWWNLIPHNYMVNRDNHIVFHPLVQFWNVKVRKTACHYWHSFSEQLNCIPLMFKHEAVKQLVKPQDHWLQ